ncbi:hypothetical protein DTO027I6_6116 [Penicillium roqueforti]|nr:hypothetical protein DTO027I6_6116 [Penicillium roqueforti]
MRWSLEAELAKRWVNLGGLCTALEIYERLYMHMIHRQLYQATGPDENDENEQFDRLERSPLLADVPRLLCIMGDIDKDEKMYKCA